MAKYRSAALGVLILLPSIALLRGSPQETLRREITRTSEKEVSVTLDASFGTVIVSKGGREKIVTAAVKAVIGEFKQFAAS